MALKPTILKALVFLSSLATVTASSGPSSTKGLSKRVPFLDRGAAVPRVVRTRDIKPARGTDLVPAFARWETDDAGRTRVHLRINLEFNAPAIQYVWFVDEARNEYTIFDIRNVSEAAPRVHAYLTARGATVSRERITSVLARSVADHLLRDRTILGKPGRARAPSTPISARPRVGTGGPSSDQNSFDDYWCNGRGQAQAQTWDPVGWFTDIGILAQTDADIGWMYFSLDDGWYVDDLEGWVNTNSGCWANEDTFAGTHWYTNDCPGGVYS